LILQPSYEVDDADANVDADAIASASAVKYSINLVINLMPTINVIIPFWL